MKNFFSQYLFLRRQETPAFHIKNLILMANVDGEYHEKENVFLKEFAKKTGTSRKKMIEIKNNLNLINFSLSQDKGVRFQQLYDFIAMMLADGKIREEEVLLCKQLAGQLDFNKDVIDTLVYSIQSNVLMGHDVEETKLRVQTLIKFNH
ncbi:MAG: hypothetical protein L0Y35_08730 [Flammeovirgaceae bacterium]|nr:hypothetical protein [Flammeovirgaceae bacterium]